MTVTADPTTLTLFDEEWVLVETTAPARYDYFTIPLTEDVGKNIPSRFVLIRSSEAEYQMDRYRSGLYGCQVSDMYSRAQVTEELQRRLQKVE